MEWWLWVLIGLGLLCTEFFVPLDFFLVFIGFGFIITGGVVSLQLLEPLWGQLALCAILSLTFTFTIRKSFVERMLKDVGRKPEFIGDTVLILEAIKPGDVGSGELRGTKWKVKNNSGAVLQSNDKRKVTAVDGLTLTVE